MDKALCVLSLSQTKRLRESKLALFIMRHILQIVQKLFVDFGANENGVSGFRRCTANRLEIES